MRTQSPYFLRDSHLHVLSQRVRFCFSAVSVLLYIRPPEYRSAFRERTLRVLSARLPVRRQKFCPPKVLLSEHSKIQAFQAFRPFFRTSGHSRFRYRNRILIRLPSLPQFGHSPPQTFPPSRPKMIREVPKPGQRRSEPRISRVQICSSPPVRRAEQNFRS